MTVMGNPVMDSVTAEYIETWRTIELMIDRLEELRELLPDATLLPVDMKDADSTYRDFLAWRDDR